MTDVNALIANPAVPDYATGAHTMANTANVLQALSQRQNDQQVIQQAGEAVANGDLKAAEDIYNRAGKVDAANLIRQRRISVEAGQLAANGDIQGAAKLHLENGFYDAAKQMTADQLKAANDIQARIADIAQTPNLTPAQWNSAIDVMKSHLPPSQRDEVELFRNFDTGPKLAIAVSGKVEAYNKTLLEQHNAQIADVKAGLVRNADVPGPIGPTPEGTPLPGKISGTVQINPQTMQPRTETFTPNPTGIVTTGVAEPGTGDISSSATLPDGYRIGPPLAKVPEGYVQKMGPDGQGFLYGPTGKPVLESKAQSDTTAKLAEKRADTERGSEQSMAEVNNVVNSARKLSDMPGFAGALELGNRAEGPSIWGASPKTLYGGIERMAAPNDPKWGVADSLSQTKNALALSLANAKMKGQGAISEGERAIIDQAVGSLDKATGPADYQFRLNAIQQLTNDWSVGKKSTVPQATRPTGDEILAAFNTVREASGDTSSTINMRKVEALATKYNTAPADMAQYILNSVEEGKSQQKSPQQSVGTDVLSKAREAIAKGAPRDAVVQRLKAAGISTEGL